MAARVIDGKAVAKEVRARTTRRIEALKEKGVVPRFAVVIAGDDEASHAYARTKKKWSERVGIEFSLTELPADCTQGALTAEIERLNGDSSVHAIMVEMPLPVGMNTVAVRHRIAPHKDVDGLHPDNLGRLLEGSPRFVCGTPAAVMELLRSEGIILEGAHAVVVGRSLNVGKPAAVLLTNANATVTLCHSRTKELYEITRSADVLVVAVGRAGFITGDGVGEGACVIDVGINFDSDGNMVGDVEFASASEVAGKITPVPGGVGPVTVQMLLSNVADAAQAPLPAP